MTYIKYIKIFLTFHKIILNILIIILLTSCVNSNYVNNQIDINFVEKEKILQKKIVIHEMSNASRKLHKIAWPILRSNIHACENARISSYGFLTAVPEDLPKDSFGVFNAADMNWQITRKNYNDVTPIIISVAPGSPADKIGLRSNDRIISVNNKNKEVKKLLSSLLINNESLNITIKRKSVRHTFKLKGVKICGFNVQPLASGAPNAYADGKNIYITIAAIKLAKSIDELAFLIGHELAHNILHFKNSGSPESEALPISYQDRPRIRKASDLFVWSSLKKETEADIEGTKYAYKAGFNLKNAFDYWRRLSIFNPTLIDKSTNSSYEGNAIRASTIDATLKKLESER